MVSRISRSSAATRLWTLLLGSSAVYFFSVNEADNDLWGHLFAGRAILARGAIPHVDTYAYTVAGGPWLDHEWGAQVALAGVYNWFGAPGLLLFKLLLASATLLLLLHVVRRRTSRVAVWGVVGLSAAAVLARGAAIRPQLFSYAGVALVLAVLDAQQRGRHRVLWWLPVIFVVWANVHGGFVLGLAVVGLFVAAQVVWPPGPLIQPLVACATAAAVTILNPYGLQLLRYLWDELSRPHPITEWQAVTLQAEHFAFLAMFVALVVTVPFGRRWREHGWQTVLALVAALFALRQQRHTPVFALCAAAPLAAQLDTAATWLRQRTRFALGSSARRVVAAALIALAGMQLTVTALRYRRDGMHIVFDPSEYPTGAVRALRMAGAHGNLAVPLDWGAYVLWHLAPQIKPSLDGRFATVFPETVVDDNFAFFRGDATWRRLIEDYPTDAALVPAVTSCPIAQEPGWRRVFADRVASLYVRADRLDAFRLDPAPRAPSAGVFP